MSTTIDQRVVEMRFDNSNFENNVKTSMSTLEKLKRALKFDGASKGLENIQSSAKKVNFSGMTNGIDQVTAKFSYMQATIQHQLNNIVDSAVNAGKRMISALTIDPVKTGFQEYETQIGAIQTILSNTQHNGTTLDEVNNALDTLNTYADKTIYNFTQMTKNIGTFTAAGVDLQTSVESIQGIANLAAISGSTSQQASTAMYQLSQALAAGRVSLMDWNSVVNAGMGGKVFQDALIRTSELLKTGAKNAIKTYGSFRESLTQGQWLTTEVLTETLKQLSGAYTEADLIAQGFTESQAKEIAELAQNAEDAATKVKTFTQLWDTLKEAAQSGWTQTWELIVGDFDEAKELLTGISDFVSKFINNSAERRNNILGGALKSPWKKFTEGLDESGIKVDDFKNKVKELYDESHKEGSFDKLVEKTGSFEKACREGAISTDLLKKAVNELGGKLIDLKGIKENLKMGDTGKDVEKVQEALKQLGYDLGKFGEKGDGIDGIIGNYTETAIKAFQEANGLKVTGIVDEETLAALDKATSKTAKFKDEVTGLIDKLDEKGGREKIIESFKNIGKAIGNVLGIARTAYQKIFPTKTVEECSNSISGIIDRFYSFTEKLKNLDDDTVSDLYWAFKGLFSVMDIVKTIATGGLSLGFKLISALAEAFGTDVLGLIGNVGKAISTFHDWIFEQNSLAKAIDGLIKKLPGVITNFKKWFSIFKQSPAVEKFISSFNKVIDLFKQIFMFDPSMGNIEDLGEKLRSAIVECVKSIPDVMVQLGGDIIAGLENGLGIGISEIPGKIADIANSLITTFCAILGIHSPSTVMEEHGENVIQGLVNGLKNGIGKVVEVIKGVAEKIIDIFKNAQWDKLFAVGVSIAMVLFVKKIADAIGGIASAFEGLGDIFDNAGKVMKSFSKVLNGISWDLKAKAIRNIAISIGILVVSIIALSKISIPDLTKAVVTIGLLSAILIGLAIAMDKFTQSGLFLSNGSAGVKGLKTGLMFIGIALLMIAATVKMVGKMDTDQLIQGFIGLTALVAEMGVFLTVCGLIGKKGDLTNIDKIGGMMIKISFALLLMAGVIKLVSGLSAGEILKGVAFAAAFTIFIKAITKVTKDSSGDINKVGSMMLKLSIAMALMVGVVKLVGLLSVEEMIKGAAFAAAFVLFVKVLVKSTQIGGDSKLAKLGGMLLSISVSLVMMVGICKLVDMLSAEEIIKGTAFVLGFIGLVKLLIKVTTVGSEQKMMKVAGTILAMSVAIGVLAAVSIALSLIDVSALAKGIVAIGLLSGLMTAMIWATRGANDVKGNLIVMTVAIAAMAGAVAALSLIDSKKLAASTASLVALMSAFALLTKLSSGAEASIKALITMTAAVALMAGILYLLDTLNVEGSIKTATSIGILLLALSSSLKIVSGINSISKDALVGIGVLTIVTAGVALILGIMSALQVEASIQSAISIGILLNAMASAALILSKIGPIAQGAAVGAGELMLVVAGVGLIISAVAGLVGSIPGAQEFLNNGIPVLEAIGTGLGKFIGGFVGGIGEGITDSLPAMSENIKAFVNNFTGIDSSAVEGAKSVVGVITAIAGANIADFISKMLTLGQDPMETFGSNLNSFGDAVISFSNKLREANIDESAIAAAANVGKIMSELQSSISMSGPVISFFSNSNNLETFGTQIKAYGEAIVSFSRYLVNSGGINEEAVTAAANAGKMMSELQSSVSMTGPVISFFANSNNLETFGTQLVAFGRSVTSFSRAIVEGGGIDESAVTAAANAGSIMAALQSNVSMSGPVVSFFANSNNLETFGTQLVAFGKGVVGFSKAIVEGGGIDESAVTAAANAGSIMAGLQSSISMTGPVLEFFGKSNNLETFGIQLAGYGAAISAFSKSVTGENAINAEAITAAANAGLIMAELQDAIPEEHWFDGKITIEEFGSKIESFGASLSAFSESVSGVNDEAINTAINASNRIKYLISSIANLDTSGVAEFTGVGTGGFGADGVAYNIAEAIAAFSNKVADINISAVNTSVSAAAKLRTLISSLVGLDSSGIENFKPESIGKNIKSYADAVGKIDTGVVSKSVSVAYRLKNFISSLSGLDNSGISSFKLNSIGTEIKDYSGAVSGIDAGLIASSIAAANKLKNFISSLAGLDTSGVGKFKSAVSSLGQVNLGDAASSLSKSATKFSSVGTSMMESLTKGISSKTSGLKNTMSNLVSSLLNQINLKRPAFATAGSQLMAQLVRGISHQRTNVTAAAKICVSGASSVIKTQWSSFYSSGKYLGDGLVLGLNAKQSAAYQAGYALGQKSAQGVKDGAKEQSPSKLTIQYGKYMGEGLIIGINSMVTKAYKAGYRLSEETVGAMSSTIAKVAEYTNAGMEAEPTIRPIMDLSDIESGVGAINGMFGQQLSVGATANLSAIGAMMSRRNQNGTNADVVSAIDKLRKDIGKVGGTSYNINGVTYDDGSNLKEAVETIIRAATMERRV